MFMVGALLRFGSVAAWVFHIIACMGGCFGCNAKTKLTSKPDEPFKGQNSCNYRTALSEDFWTTSTCDMDNNAVQSHGSISSTSTLTQGLHDAYGAGCSNKSSEFVNQGLILWNQTRQKWLKGTKPENRAKELLEPRLSWNATYDNLLSSNKPFRRPVPLGEMVDFLVDVWEQEGLYD